MHLDKKAFTMIELLATITILGIVMVVSISAVTSLIERSKKEYYNSQEKNVTLAAQSYAQSNRDYLPKGIGQKNRIKLSTLLKSNYLKEVVKDYNKKNCDMEKSYIDIFKYSQKDYSYVVYLQCPNYNSTEQMNKITPDINISISGNSMKDAKAVIKIKGNEKLMGYSYTIFYRKNSTDSWEEKINSGSLSGNQSTSREVTFSLAEYVPGNIKIQVSATNIYGMNTSKTATHEFKDNDGPECVYINEDDKYVKGSSTHRSWITDKTQSRKITVGCNDGNGVGCARATYTKTFTDDAISGEIKIKDKSGNSTTCQVSVYIDKTAPTIKFKTYKRSSSGKTGSVLKEVQANDKNRSVSIDSCFANNKDYNCWMNKAQYPDGVYYELEYEDNFGLAKEEWLYNASAKKKNDSGVNDLISSQLESKNLTGTKQSSSKKIKDEGFRVANLKIIDEAGNVSEVNVTAAIDRTAPNTPNISNDHYYDWSNKPFSLILYSDDSVSGIDYYQYSYDKSTWNTYSDSNKTKFTTTEFSLERNQNVYMRARDEAGNYSEISASPIRIDKTAPSILWSHNPGTYNSTQTITIGCKDNLSNNVSSGISKDTYLGGSYTEKLSTPNRVYSFQCTDNAGNTTWEQRTISVVLPSTGGSGSSGGSSGGSGGYVCGTNYGPWIHAGVSFGTTCNQYLNSSAGRNQCRFYAAAYYNACECRSVTPKYCY